MLLRCSTSDGTLRPLRQQQKPFEGSSIAAALLHPWLVLPAAVVAAPRLGQHGSHDASCCSKLDALPARLNRTGNLLQHSLCNTALRLFPAARFLQLCLPGWLTCTRSLLHHPRGRSCQATTRALITAEAATFIRKICSGLSWCIRGNASCSWPTSASTQEASSREITAAAAGQG